MALLCDRQGSSLTQGTIDFSEKQVKILQHEKHHQGRANYTTSHGRHAHGVLNKPAHTETIK